MTVAISSLARRAALLLTLSLALPALAAAADTEPYRLTLSGSFQVDRLNSPLADSLNLTMTHANRADIGFDFRVLSLPLAGAEQPAIHVIGDVATSERPIAMLTTTGATATLKEIPITELTAGLALTLPMAMIDPNAGARLYAGYQGTLVLAGGRTQDFLRMKRAMFGFERTRGLFEGSRAELAYGRNESWGLAHAAHRWQARFRAQVLLGPGPGPGAGRPVAGKPAPPPRPSTGSPLRAFIDLNADTDAGAGADGIQTQLGLMLDMSNVLQRAMGTLK